MLGPLQKLAAHQNNLQQVVWDSRAMFDDASIWLPSALEYLVFIGGMYDELIGYVVAAYATKPDLRDAVLWSMAGAMYETQETIYGGTVFGVLRALGVPPEPRPPVPDTAPTAAELRAAEVAAEPAVARVRAASGKTPTGATRATAQTIIEEIKRTFPDAFSTMGATVDPALVKSVVADEVRAQLAATKAVVNETAAERVAATGNWKADLISFITANKSGPMTKEFAGKVFGLAATSAIALITLAVGKSIVFGSSSDDADDAADRAEARSHAAMLDSCAGDAGCIADEMQRYAERLRAGKECSMLSTPYGTVLGGLVGIGGGWALMRKLKNWT